LTGRARVDRADREAGTVKVGDTVRLRRERWRITDVAGDPRCPVVTLTGLGPSNLRHRQRVLAPFERFEPVARRFRPRFVHWKRWRQACRATIAGEGDWLALGAVTRARVDVLPHQLEPALAVLSGLGTRLLLADGVGLGKTIEAGILIAELFARGVASRALLLTPAGLRDQWAAELDARFGLQSAVVDARRVRLMTATLPVGVNPWTTTRVAIVSLDFVKRPEVLPAAWASPWDIVVVDEAHRVVPGTDRYAAVSSVCGSAAFVFLLTATPHSGDSGAFDALCRLGGHDEPVDAPLVFRRTRADVLVGGRRRAHTRLVRPTPAEARLHDALDRYAAEVGLARESDEATGLLLTLLYKRAWSSAASLARSLEHRRRTLGAGSRQDSQLPLPFAEAGERDDEDEPPSEALIVPALEDLDHERRLLAALSELSLQAARGESKLRVLARLLARCRRRSERVIVFTEYRDTLRHVQHALGALATDGVLLHGGMDRHERLTVLDTFTSGRSWLLLSTDVGSEGLNLHQACRVVVHLELPWNPVRLEQRIGRVDRMGQRQTVHSWCLVARESGERRLVDRLSARVARARAQLATVERTDLSVTDGAQSGASAHARADAGDLGHSDAHVHEPDLVCRSTALAGRSVTEAQRIEQARQMSRHAPAALLEGSLVVSTPRGRARRRLGSQALVLLESALEDEAGRRVAAHVEGLAVLLNRRPPRRNAVSLAVGLLASEAVRRAIDDRERSKRWTTEAMQQYRAFWRTCVSRAVQTRQTLERTDRTALYQSGLFDRRAERQHQVLADEHAARLVDLDIRLSLYRDQLDGPVTVRRTVLAVLP